jgi:UDP-glucose 4-epimerase
MNVLVTGGAGYIGSHVVWALLDAGHSVVVVDDLSTGVRENLPADLPFVEARAGSGEPVDAALHEHDVDTIIHFAGSIVVPESVENPLKYYDNNVSQGVNLLKTAVEAGVKRFVFSSTAAVYGEPESNPITESTPKAPINPYGHSKLMFEQVLADTSAAHGLDYCALRYFNVAGADPQGRTGQSTPNATHLIKIAAQAALGERDKLAIFGTDYDTPDGTCIRDYIHVTDLATAHLAAMRYLADGGESGPFNCGYGRGFSVREVIDVVKEVSGLDFPVEETGRRAGDPPALVADSGKLRAAMAWEPAHDDLSTIVRTALAWERSLR